jgi:chemotaxis signal transduction protein
MADKVGGGHDWRSVRNLLAQGKSRLERALDSDAAQMDEVFSRRAKRLAERGTQEVLARKSGYSLLVFRIGSERYGMPVSEILSVHPGQSCTSVPGAPVAILGILSAQGDAYAVLNPSLVLELPNDSKPGATGSTGGYVLLLARKGFRVGIWVDGIEGVDEAEALEGSLAMAHRPFLKLSLAEPVILILSQEIFTTSLFAAGTPLK